MQDFFAKNKLLLGVVLLYFVVRLTNLTLIPIFNDEAIYLDWGWRMTHGQIVWNYSLGDAKPPLLMWLFGVFSELLSDPLFAGRFVSVLVGLLSLLGIYKLAKKISNKTVAIYASILYIFIPIFSFYDRQALMESGITAVGIWSAYYTVQLFTKPQIKNALILGVILGIGLFIKSNAVLFLIAYLLIALFIFFKSSKQNVIIRNTLFIFLAIGIVDLLLFIEPEYWKMLSSNSRYSLTFGELIAFPLVKWIDNFIGNIDISFLYLTPLVFLTGLIGCVIYLRQSKDIKSRILLLLLIIPIILEVLDARFIQQRYIVSFLPLFCIFSAYLLWYLVNKSRETGYFVIAFVFIVPITLTAIQIINPISYFSILANMAPYSDKEGYVTGSTAGYGITEAFNKMKSLESGKIVIGTAVNTGNPESAVRIMAAKEQNLQVAYFDMKTLGGSLDNVACLTPVDPATTVYFLSRDDQQVGLDKFLNKTAEIKNPYGNHYLGIYKLKNNCSNNSLPIDFQSGSAKVVDLSQASPPQASSEAQRLPSVQPQLPVGWSQFSDKVLNLQFNYPTLLKIEKEDANTVALYDVSHSRQAEKMQFYSTEGTDISTMKPPFQVSGQFLKEDTVEMSDFKALMKVYSSPSVGYEQFLFLQKDKQIFVVKFPANKALDPMVVNAVVQSIKPVI